MLSSYEDDEPVKQMPRTQPSHNAMWSYFVNMVFWAVSAWTFAIAAWHDGVTGLFHTGTPLLYAVGDIGFALLFWLMVTNWRGWAKRLTEKPMWGNRHPPEYVRPESRFFQAATRFDTPLIVLGDLLAIAFVLGR